MNKTLLLLQRFALRRKGSAECCTAKPFLRLSDTTDTPQGA
ncbi:hypothetical protein [Metaplanococcus flavidus]|uniref:Uncharacterized protein n=1 Tax=Metaplanococcus flavidus TaxID=569883 RepID=A0ABW3L756_9BACL